MNQTTIHINLLMEQISCLFRYVNDARIHRSRFSEFKPLQVDGETAVSYRYETGMGGHSVVTITVETDNRKFEFIQQYNFGVLLSLHVCTQANAGRARIPLRDIEARQDIDPNEKHQILIDFEYAISLVTEHIAGQILLHQGQ